MKSLFIEQTKNAIPIELVDKDDLETWIRNQSEYKQNWLKSQISKEPSGQVLIVPSSSGAPEQVIYISSPKASLWDDAILPMHLKQGVYSLTASFDKKRAEQVYLASGLQQYHFDRYKKVPKHWVQLTKRSDVDFDIIEKELSAIYLVRDLITTPANDMGPQELEEAARQVAKENKAKVKVISGESLLKHNYPGIYTVGKGSSRPPRLIDMTWGSKTNPKITLVGKGVCFDSGGLNVKNASGMLLMKKDMGGAATALALAKLVMERNLPVRLRLLIPAVENSISGNSYRPMDVIKMRCGKTVEVGNTDAEGRLIVADALTEADSEQPDLIIDCTTLTGAARVALGTDLPALFSNRIELAQTIADIGHKIDDPLWPMPLWKPYKANMRSKIADISSTGSGSYGGAITAALFLSEFVENNTPWVHLDMMAYNLRDHPGRPEGGEAMALRALYAYLEARIK